MKRIKVIAALLLSLMAINVNAQTDKPTTKRIVEAKKFIFVASAALPMNSAEINTVLRSMPGANSGGNIDLTGGNYDVRVTPDSLIAYLPYYGRSFSAPMDRNESGFKFTSTKFSYENTTRKRGGWQISINPKDTKESVRMSLNISDSGYATLVVSSNNKQTITYNGYLKEPKN